MLEVPDSVLGSGKMGLWVAHWTAQAGNGFRRIAVRGQIKLPSSPANRTPPISLRSRRTTPVSSPFSRTRWNTPVDIRQRKQRGSQGPCCRTSSTIAPQRPAVYPTNGRTLTDDVVDFFLPLLSNGKVTQDKVGPHKDLLAEFPYVGAPHQARATERVAA